MADSSLVTWQRDGNIATITISNPPMNALSQKVASELKSCVEEIAKDGQAIVVILTGAGERAFCAGADIKEFPNYIGSSEAKGFVERIHDAINALDDLVKPTIAAINGFALGGGLEVSMACDIRIAAENAQLGQPEIKLGVIPGGGGTQRLPRLVGEAYAKEINYVGDPVSAQEALRIGLVNKVVPQGQAYSAAKEMAEAIASRSGAALALIKKAMDEGIHEPIDKGMAIERKYFAESFQLEDAKEGADAFINKRPPQFKHR